jgi:hypothetical protein
MTKETREFEPINIKVYKDEDQDLVEYLKGKPKTWLVKEALRFYRDNHGRSAAQQPQQTQLTAAEEGLGGIGGI